MPIKIYVGATCTGKTFKADADNPGAFWAPFSVSKRNLNRYKNQDAIILDSFLGNHLSMTSLIKLLDHYRSDELIITSIVPPEAWYSNVEDVSMLRQMIDDHATIYEFTSPCPFNSDGLPCPITTVRRLGPRTV